MSTFPSTPSFSLEGKNALIAGASSGIGMACAVALAEHGAEVTLAARRTEALQDIAAEMTARGWKARVLLLDVADVEATAEAVAENGPFDILVNSAGLARHGKAVETAPEDFDAVMGVNVRGAYFLAAGLVPGMLERGHGSIINVTTMVASKGVPGAGAYSASKAALESLTRTWAAEFGPSGIRVNSVAPGPTRTEGVEAEWGETNEQLGRSLPLGRTASPDEIAEAVLFLASERATFITGSVLHADGGGSAV